MNAKTSMPTRITIVGGGFTGASTAVQLVRASAIPLAITIVEARPKLGAGIAHSADDPDHRLNGPAFLHYVDPADPLAFQRWCEDRNLVQGDPGALVPGGSLYPRRSEFGKFVAETVRTHEHWATGSVIRHLQAVAEDLTESGELFTLRTKEGQTIQSEMVIVATGNALPQLPQEFKAIDPSSAGIVAVPTDLDRVRGLPKSARVLVLGTGLTALDILSTLVRAGHQGPITAVSRRGLRPASQRPPPPSQSKPTIYEWPSRIDSAVPPFILAAGPSPTARKLLRALRERIREVEAAGDLWYTPYDELRDSFWQVWPTVPLAEKKRYLKRLRPWFDNFRFRSPPQNDAMVRQAEAAGLIQFGSTRIHAAERLSGGVIRVFMRDRGASVERTQDFDAVINCTGLDPAAGIKDNPFLSSLMRRDLVCVDSTGVGLAADDVCRSISANGRVRDTLRLIGPPTNGSFADQVGAAFIAARIRRALPSLLATIQVSHLRAGVEGGHAFRTKESA